MKWECFICWKINEDDEAADEKHCLCHCCGRPRNFVPTSLIINSKAKPLVLHGLASAQHEFHPALVHALQQSGLDLADTDSGGWTALHCAAMLDDATAIHCLLQPNNVETKIDIKKRLEATRSGGWRALHVATREGHLSAVEELLLADADVDARLDESDDALTPLHIAAQHGYIDILDLLLQCGADPTLLTHNLRRSPLHLAVFGGHERCVRLLLAKPNIAEILDRDGLTALQLANIRLSSDQPTAAQRELIVLLEAHQPFRALPPISAKSLLS
ncbi:hypothetical protein PPTG_21378 [Phytophthora nicotianae INRA-310]|uniref:Uncharacterized protein n=2 Tax=Phytophthora nicotianae TaxID=4792 RepID=W2R0I8_PHYN3|nr:hypothetical protein PPTG_21378 [Phytophthora nicotianae INRA-310]ETN18952.1 hypothetical protein PPTG_21378 [Phytophthora nicotianae INRA-310]